MTRTMTEVIENDVMPLSTVTKPVIDSWQHRPGLQERTFMLSVGNIVFIVAAPC